MHERLLKTQGLVPVKNVLEMDRFVTDFLDNQFGGDSRTGGSGNMLDGIIYHS